MFKKSKFFRILLFGLIAFLPLKSAETHPSARKCYGEQKGTPKTTLCENPYPQLRDRTQVQGGNLNEM